MDEYSSVTVHGEEVRFWPVQSSFAFWNTKVLEALNIQQSHKLCKQIGCGHLDHCDKDVSALFLPNAAACGSDDKGLKGSENQGSSLSRRVAISVCVDPAEGLKRVERLYILKDT